MDNHKNHALYCLSEYYLGQHATAFPRCVGKSNDKSTNAAELHTCNVEECGLGLIKLFSRFLAEKKNHNAGFLFVKRKTEF